MKLKKEIDTQVIVSRLKLLEKYVTRLKELKKLPKGRFSLPDNLDIAAYNLRSSLEATFDVCSHILSRIPGAEVGEYKRMAQEMGKQNIVPKKFSEEKLYKMAGYRNRLTHLYFEVSAQEMYKIIQNDLGDFEIFMKHIKKVIA